MTDPVPHGAGADPADPACDVAHGRADDIAHGYAEAPVTERTLIAVFASPVARFLLSYARDAGFRPLLVDPDPESALTSEARLAGTDGTTALDGLDLGPVPTEFVAVTVKV